MRWTRKVPTKPGLYLRNNPVSVHVVQHHVFEIDGEMCIGGDGLIAVRLRNWGGARFMWWFGPIPLPPRKRR